jgi:hypothetical protein
VWEANSGVSGESLPTRMPTRKLLLAQQMEEIVVQLGGKFRIVQPGAAMRDGMPQKPRTTAGGWSFVRQRCY